METSSKVADAVREVPFGTNHNEANFDRFPDNTVTTSKYTVFTFIPKNLYEQFHKAANVYFAFISLLLYIGELNYFYMESIKAYSTFLTLAAMMACSAILFALDDYRRHVSDRQTNGQPAKVARGKSGELGELTWSRVKVGDVLVIQNEEELPADIVPLACSGEQGTCYVSTANLDGETNLKLKSAASAAHAVLCAGADAGPPSLNSAVSELPKLSGKVRAEAPTNSIHNFTGSMQLAGENEQALGPKELLLRGTTLRNTAWCIGVVVYTGRDTRVVMNSRKAPMKLSNLERAINVSMLVILAAQAVMALVSDIFYTANAEDNTYQGHWYLSSGRDLVFPDILAYAISFFGLYSNLMPISLYATIEVCNAAQALFIKSDLEMFDEEFDCPAAVRSTNLCQELGQVEYIFSDKTGTLTQNVMELKRVSIAGEVYGEVGEEKGFQGGHAMSEARKRDSRQSDAIDAFLEVLAVSHTVMVSRDDDGVARYEAESPDEGALVGAAAELGWVFQGRQGQTMEVEVGLGEQRESKKYEVLAVNAFTSTRKRMSVIVQKGPGDYYLFVKGADNVMLDRSVGTDPRIQVQLIDFAREGLRTLVVGRRKLPESEFTAWFSEYERAQRALADRDEALASAAEKIETRLVLLGVTAIEDKLQVGVGETIERLRKGGMKLWVLTGDKLETAQNIGFSARVLSEDMEILTLDVGEGDEAPGKVSSDFANKLKDMDSSARKAEAGLCVLGLMVTGRALEELKLAGLEDQFLALAQQCSVVIACRVSPLQKAEMVSLVRRKVQPRPVTLAVGDGANDVPMIQQAQVGVGIWGREGRQAVNSADFAVGQFRFLQRLLLVHGRLDYHRTCKFTLYTFWRNAVQVLLMFYYSFMSGYSGISLFEDKVRMTFNVILSIPIIATGIFDRDVSDQTILDHPELYESGRLGQELNPKRMAETLVSAVVHSLVILAITLLAFPGMDLKGAGDYYTFGTAVYTCLIILSNYRVAFLTITWNWFSVGSLALSFAMYAFFLAVYGALETLGPPMYSVPAHMASNLPFWLCAIAVPVLASFVDAFTSYVWLEFRPSRRDLIRESLTEGVVQNLIGEIKPPAGPMIETPSQPPLSTGLPPTCPGAEAPCFAFDQIEGEAVPEPSSSPPTTSSTSVGGTGGWLEQNVRPLLIGQPAQNDSSSAGDCQKPTVPANLANNKSITSGSSCDAGGARGQRPPDLDFTQQRLPSWQFVFTWRRILVVMGAAGVVLLGFGLIAISLSRSAQQVRIQYDGADSEGPLGTQPEELHRRRCVAGGDGSTSSCVVTVSVAEDMEPPILLYYSVDAFHQNYLSYVLSVAWLDCKADGDAGPCGSPATTFFNDTFELCGASAMPIDETGLAWETDLERFGRGPGGGAAHWFSKLRTTPEHFVAWLRPDALPRTRKPYGYLQERLRKGQEISVCINASFPVEGIHAQKELVLTTLTSLGGRDDALGIFLLASGVACLVACMAVAVIQLSCAREPGEADRRRCMAQATPPAETTTFVGSTA